jgi:hypothetical protein
LENVAAGFSLRSRTGKMPVPPKTFQICGAGIARHRWCAVRTIPEHKQEDYATKNFYREKPFQIHLNPPMSKGGQGGFL